MNILHNYHMNFVESFGVRDWLVLMTFPFPLAFYETCTLTEKGQSKLAFKVGFLAETPIPNVRRDFVALVRQGIRRFFFSPKVERIRIFVWLPNNNFRRTS